MWRIRDATCVRRRPRQSPSCLRTAGCAARPDYGIYPYTTSSNTIATYAPIGAGLPTAKIDQVVGVVKAYSSLRGRRTVHLRMVWC